VHAVARLMLHGSIDHIQAAWTKLGLETSQAVLLGGADDLGGLLLDGVIAPELGAEAHRSLSIADVERVAAEIGRTARQRTTDYGSPTPEQLAVARRADAPPASRLHLKIGARQIKPTPPIEPTSRIEPTPRIEPVEIPRAHTPEARSA
jgi:FO synthase